MENTTTRFTPRPPAQPAVGSDEWHNARERERPTPTQQRHLMGGGASDGCYETLDQYSAAWVKWRHELLPLWAKNNPPGTRPAGWWICDCQFSDQLPANEGLVNPYHFGRTIPPTEDQAPILELHFMLTPEEIDALDQMPVHQ